MDLFGSDALAELSSKTILCSGRTIAKTNAIIQYLDVLNENVRKVDDEFHQRFANLGGIDQGIHNYIYSLLSR